MAQVNLTIQPAALSFRSATASTRGIAKRIPTSRAIPSTSRSTRMTLKEDLFGPNQDGKRKNDRTKVTIVGAGQVGLACAYSMLNQTTCREIQLVDIPPKIDQLEAEVEDLLHGAQFVQDINVKASTEYKASAGSDIVIIPAGARQNEGESRLDLVNRNVAIFESIIPQIVEASPDATLLILTNPVDIMTHVAQRISGFPPGRVVGSGTALDTSRFRSLLAQKLDVDTGSVHGLVLGEHGDSSVVAWSQLNIGGVRVKDVHPQLGTDEAEEDLQELHSRVVQAAGRIIKRKGYTNWALGLAVASLVQCILRDERHIIPLSVPASGHYGITQDVHLSLPAVLGAGGVHEVVNMPLSEDEAEKLRDSARVLDDVQGTITYRGTYD